MPGEPILTELPVSRESAFELRPTACPICGDTVKKKVGVPGRFNRVFQPLALELASIEVVRCESCSAMYLYPMIFYSDRLRSDMYHLGYFDGDLKNMGEKVLNLRLAERYVGPLRGKRFLDIGCGTGEYIKIAAERGMLATGIDVDQTIVDHIQKKYPCDMVCGLLQDSTFPAASFDVVVLSHVIEHLQEPADILRIIRNIVKPSGVFIMGTPNADSLMEKIHETYARCRYDKSKTYILTPFTEPYHILGFNLKSAKQLLRRSGFTPLYAKARSGLEWADGKNALAMKLIKVAGACLGQGMSIVTISRPVTT